MDEAKNAVVVYKGFKDFDEKVSVITDQGYFGFYKTKKDGTPTRAVGSLKALAPQVGDSIDVLYKETVSNGKTYKNALSFYAPREGSANTIKIIPAPGAWHLQRPEAQEDRNTVLINLTENIHKLDDRLRILENRMSMLELPEEKKEVSRTEIDSEVSISDVPF
jgi:hypothetical protein